HRQIDVLGGSGRNVRELFTSGRVSQRESSSLHRVHRGAIDKELQGGKLGNKGFRVHHGSVMSKGVGRNKRVLMLKTGTAANALRLSVGDYDRWFNEALASSSCRLEKVEPHLGEMLPKNPRTYDAVLVTG